MRAARQDEDFARLGELSGEHQRRKQPWASDREAT